MFKGRGRDPRAPVATPAHLTRFLNNRAPAPLAKPEPDYEVVEFPSDQYVNAKLQAPSPPPRPPTGHPQDAGASCGLCGGGGARVRCAECGRQALCASCDDMYHRHPKRRHHQRQALPPSQMSDVRPPLPPKSIAPVPPPRRHKISGDRSSASPKPPAQDQRRATLGSIRPSTSPLQQPPILPTNHRLTTQHVRQPTQIQAKTSPTPAQVHTGSVPYLPSVHHPPAPVAPVQVQSNTIGHAQTVWNRPRALPVGYNNLAPNMAIPAETWERPDSISPSAHQWGRPLRRGASVLELGGGQGCAGCGHCAPMPWRYGSCASLDHPWSGGGWPTTCCVPPQSPFNPHMHPHAHHHPPQTPQTNRRGESRTMSRAASRTGSRMGSRAASPAMSMRSRASRRTKHRTPSPPPLSSSDADSESESESDHKPEEPVNEEESLGPAPSPPSSSWQCEHCTFVNEPGVRVCVVCCRTPTTAPKIVTVDVDNKMTKLEIVEDAVPPANNLTADVKRKQNGGKSCPSKERKSTSCGPSPPRDDNISKNSAHRHVTPSREQTNGSVPKIRHEMGCGPSPPRESNNVSALESTNTVRASPYREIKTSSSNVSTRHSVSVGPSPPRDTRLNNNNQSKKSTGTSPSRDIPNESRTTVSNTGTSPPPQTISTQTYEVPSTWERSPSVPRNRSRRPFRDDGRQRERSHSRHSLSSDTRDSERSVRTSGGRWEWRETRDSSPGGEWSGSERRRTSSRLTRRASHLDINKNRYNQRNSLYGSEAASPEPLAATRAISLEALAGAGALRETERGLELAKLMSDAEKLGFSAAEVHAALGQNPLAPLSWLRSRWAGLCAGVRAAAARVQPGLQLGEREARAALARHRGNMWPAVTECVEKYRRNSGVVSVEEGRLRGHVWGSPVGVEDDAAPPQSSFRNPSHRTRAEESSDEFDVPSPMQVQEDDDWMFLPLHSDHIKLSNYGHKQSLNNLTDTSTNIESEDFAQKLNTLLIQAGMPSIDGNLLLKGLLAENLKKTVNENSKPENIQTKSSTPIDLDQSENDFINAYNALTRLSPLPVNVTKNDNFAQSILNTVAQNIENNKNNNVKSPLTGQEVQLDSFVQNETRIPIPIQTTQQIDVTNSHSTDVQNTFDDEKANARDHEINVKILPQVSNNVEANVRNELRSDEKTSNLNEIVDNTQKLIQQMKEEINSDINSLDERNMSESEEGNSSDQSDLSTEHESSYSESGDNTNDMSSEGHESSSSSDENSVNNSHKINRTSSEENEQFEEAMDHIDEQMEDFKQTNMEILDSIARSLQEEHTISVKEINNNVKPSLNEQFNTVNTFEEIYQDVSNSHSELQNQRNSEKYTKAVSPVRPIRIIYTKHEINVVQLKNEPPIELRYSNHKPDHFNAALDIVNESSSVSNLTETNEQETTMLNNDEENNNDMIVTENTFDPTNSQDGIIEPVSQEVNEIKTQNIDSTTQQNVIENSKKQTRNNSESESNSEPDIILSQKKKENTEPDQPDQTNVRGSAEKILFSSSSKLTINKSSIPKLVKVVQNTTTKISPKVISSKVPVRRSSIKQYAAPAPPKAPFGKIQSGNVKQLQTKLFNNKPTKTVVNNSRTPLPSTSSFNKKKPAPPPPVKADAPSNLGSPTKKKNFFRETCRTEDEWTDSDSDDSQFQPIVSVEEPPCAPPSPPPPVTMRRVSGQLIDLARVRLPEGSPERQARMLLAEGAIENWEQARLAVELVSRGTDPPAALLAALECNDLNSALTYLQQDCELCASRLPEHEMVSMLRCTHRCCRECAQVYFTVQITERSIADCVCPFCKEPELESLPEDSWLEYFAHLDILLKTLLEVDVHELFQRKLRDRTLALDPNFRWCVECSSGFFVHPKHKKLRCPECRSVSCATCRKPWSSNHDGLSCEEYAKWLEDNDPERSVAAVQQHLKENGLECPRCHFKYSLSRGGCMHFTCTQCKYEFCYGCGKPFKMGARCDLSEYCAKLGLHAHHPRNCLFYLRDKEPHELQTLLQMNNVTYETEAQEGATNRCPIQLQRETPTGLVDSQCGGNVPKNHAGLCKNHYVEYLSRLIRARRMEPLPILGVDDLETLVRRAALRLPPRPYGTLEGFYKRGLIEIVKEKIPLD